MNKLIPLLVFSILLIFPGTATPLAAAQNAGEETPSLENIPINQNAEVTPSLENIPINQNAEVTINNSLLIPCNGFSAINIDSAFGVGGLAFDGTQFHLMLETNTDADGGAEIFIVSYNSFADLLADNQASASFAILNPAPAFSVGGFAFDGTQFHVMLETNNDADSGAEIFFISYNSFADLLANNQASFSFSALNISPGYDVGGLTFDGTRFHVMLESSFEAGSGVEIFIVSYISVADLLANNDAGASFSAQDIVPAFSVGGLAFDGTQFHEMLESDTDADSGAEIFFISYNSFADLLADNQDCPGTDLSITKSDSIDPVDPGDTITYTMRVSKPIGVISTNPVLTDVLPAGVTFVPSSSPICKETSPGLLECNFGLSDSQTFTDVIFDVTVDADACGTLTNTASVIGDEFDPDTSNNMATETTIVNQPCKIPPPPTPPVGGEYLPIESTSLLVAGAQSFSWMIPVVLSVLGIGLFVVSRKSENP